MKCRTCCLQGNEHDREEVCTLWRHYHMCDCPNQWTVTNPKARYTGTQT